jgi:hypothetical protein
LKKAAILSLMMGMLMILFILASGNIRKNALPPAFLDYANADIPALRDRFEQEKSDQNLLILLKALCGRAEQQDEMETGDLIGTYGAELYRRSRENGLDLQTLDREDTMRRLLGLINKYGAK